MKALILGRGFGGDWTANAAPLPLLPVGGEPLLVHTLQWLARYDISDVAIIPGERPEVLQDAIGDGSAWGVNVIYAPASPLETGEARTEIEPFIDETTVVVAANLLLDVDLADLLDYHRSRHALVTLGLQHAERRSGHTMVECDSAGRVLRLVEHPATWLSTQHTAAVGLDVVEPDVVEHLPPQRSADWSYDALSLLVAAGEAVYGQLVSGPLVAIQSQADYERVKATGLQNEQDTR